MCVAKVTDRRISSVIGPDEGREQVRFVEGGEGKQNHDVPYVLQTSHIKAALRFLNTHSPPADKLIIPLSTLCSFSFGL